MEEFYRLNNQLNTTYDLLQIGQIVFAIIGAIGLIMIIYGYYKNLIREKRRGLYILIFGGILSICLYLIEGKLRSNVYDRINNFNYHNIR